MRISILILIAALGASILTACNGSSYTSYQYLSPYDVSNAVETSETTVAIDNETLSMQKYVVARSSTSTKIQKYDEVVISVVFEAFKPANSTSYTTSYKYSASTQTIRIGIDATLPGLENGLLDNLYKGDKVRLMMPPGLAYGANGAYISSTGSYSYPFAWYLVDFEVISVTRPTTMPEPYDKTFATAFKDTVSLASGLKYIKCVTTNNTKTDSLKNVTIRYTGYLANGEIFDTNVTNGGSFAFQIEYTSESVIVGILDAVKTMRVGEKIRALIPSNLGYKGQSKGKIKPFTDLIFDIELLTTD